jgi:hypothetical protein
MEGAHARAVVYRRLPARPKIAAPITLVHREGEPDAAVATFLDLARRTARELRASSKAQRR